MIAQRRLQHLERNVVELNEELTALEQVRIVNHILYDSEGFTNAKSGRQIHKHLGVMAQKKAIHWVWEFCI